MPALDKTKGKRTKQKNTIKNSKRRTLKNTDTKRKTLRWYDFIMTCVGIILIISTMMVVILQLVLRLVHHTAIIRIREKTCGTKGRFITTDDGRVYTMEDSFWLMSFKSTELFGTLQVEKTYRARIFGKRIPFFGLYPTIRTANPLED